MSAGDWSWRIATRDIHTPQTDILAQERLRSLNNERRRHMFDNRCLEPALRATRVMAQSQRKTLEVDRGRLTTVCDVLFVTTGWQKMATLHSSMNDVPTLDGIKFRIRQFVGVIIKDSQIRSVEVLDRTIQGQYSIFRSEDYINATIAHTKGNGLDDELKSLIYERRKLGFYDLEYENSDVHYFLPYQPSYSYGEFVEWALETATKQLSNAQLAIATQGALVKKITQVGVPYALWGDSIKAYLDTDKIIAHARKQIRICELVKAAAEEAKKFVDPEEGKNEQLFPLMRNRRFYARYRQTAHSMDIRVNDDAPEEYFAKLDRRKKKTAKNAAKQDQTILAMADRIAALRLRKVERVAEKKRAKLRKTGQRSLTQFFGPQRDSPEREVQQDPSKRQRR